MKLPIIISSALLLLLSGSGNAGDSTLDAAIGGGVGGAIGGAVGNEVGGRDGAIIGSAIGAAAGTAITTKDSNGEHREHRDSPIRVDVGHSSRFCPPGQAMKGRC